LVDCSTVWNDQDSDFFIWSFYHYHLSCVSL
jgi:hypothetical protein